MAERYTTDAFIKKAREVHGHKYNYSRVDYKNGTTKVEMICADHGSWFATPHSHLTGSGCYYCAREYHPYKQMSTQSYKEKVIKVHGDEYDYCDVIYKGMEEEICIHCREHGEFWQKAKYHLYNEAKCPDCREWVYKSELPTFLYVLASENLTKVGVTVNNPEVRKNQINNGVDFEFRLAHFWQIPTGKEAYKLESEILIYLNDRFEKPQLKFTGYTECFYDLDPSYLKHLIEQRIREMSSDNILNNEQHSSQNLLGTA